jgi:hypothetical protein
MPPKSPPAAQPPVPADQIDRRIYIVRGQKVMLDSDLADLYQVTTGNLNLAVRRNAERIFEGYTGELYRKSYPGILRLA